jgi:cytidine deaminase
LEKDTEERLNRLREAAGEAMGRAHAPYSLFRVGAAVETGDGRIFAGCNVENASFSATMCAERVALGTAIASGARSFLRVFVCSSSPEPVAPCGVCRQALSEFGTDMEVVSEGTSGCRQRWRLSELLPGHFELNPDARGGEEAG